MAPELSLHPREISLVKANEIRTKRAQLKRDLKVRKISAVMVLNDSSDWLKTMKTVDFLMALPDVGPVKVRRHLNKCRISSSSTIGGMSDRQREELQTVLAKEELTYEEV